MIQSPSFIYFPVLLLLAMMPLPAQRVTVSAPADQRLNASEYTNRDTNQLLDKNTKWRARANQRNAVFTLEAPSFQHTTISAERPTRLSLTASRTNKWTVTTGTDDSSQGGKAEVKAVKNRPGGGRATFNLKVYFLEETTERVAPAGTYQMSVTGTISAGP